MSSTPFVIGSSIEDYQNADPHYLYALRKTDEGDLYLLRLDIFDTNDEAKLFGQDIPSQFADISLPGDDYFDNRDPITKELIYSREDVIYEQWKWDNRFNSYYIDNDGELISAINEDIPMRVMENIIDTTNAIFTLTLTNSNNNVNIYDRLISSGWNGISEVEVINNGTINSNTPTKAAVLINGLYPNGITLINNGEIFGATGIMTSNHEYILGGYAIEVLTACNITNNPTGNIRAGLSLLGVALVDSYTPVVDIALVTLVNTGTFLD